MDDLVSFLLAPANGRILHQLTMIEPKIVTIIYQSGKHPTENWDVMQVVGKYESGTVANSYVLARDAAGTILRKTDIVLERWEIMTDKEDLRICRKHFDDRDALAEANQSHSPAE